MARKKNNVSNIAKQVKESKGKSIEKDEPVTGFISTGITLLDCCWGGGLPIGKIVNLVGDKSTGKTLLALETIACAISTYGDDLVFKYNDAESGLSFNTEKMYGFEIDEENEPSDTVEDFSDDLEVTLDSLEGDDDRLIYVLDSLDALSSEAEIRRDDDRKEAIAKGKPYKEGTYNLEKQKMLGKLFRLKSKRIKTLDCLLIIISQVRSNITGYGKEYYRTGGKALDHYSGNVTWFAEREKTISKGRVTGVTLHAKNEKNKLGLPFRECFINVVFDYGVDNISSNIDFLYDLKTDKGKLSKEKARKLKWDRKEMSRGSLISYIEDNDLEDELAQKVKDKWQAIEDSVASKRKSKYE